MTLGEKIKEARKNTGLSQEQLAEKLAVSRSAIAKWESDKGLPDIDNTLGFLTDAPFGTPGLINSFKNMNKEYYLVNQGEQQYLVCIDEEFIETRKIMTPITSKKFEIGSWKFLKCRYVVK